MFDSKGPKVLIQGQTIDSRFEQDPHKDNILVRNSRDIYQHSLDEDQLEEYKKRN